MKILKAIFSLAALLSIISESIAVRNLLPARYCAQKMTVIKEKLLEKTQSDLEKLASDQPKALDLHTLQKPRGSKIDSPNAIARRLILSRLAALGKIPTFSQRTVAASKNDYTPQSHYLTRAQELNASTITLVEDLLPRIGTKDFIARLDATLAATSSPVPTWTSRQDYLNFLLAVAKSRLQSFHDNRNTRYFLNSDSPAYKSLVQKSMSMERLGISEVPQHELLSDLIVAVQSLTK